MINFVFLMLIPIMIAVAVLLYFKGKVTYGEFFGQLGAVAFLIFIGLVIAYVGRTQDTEVWNGQITKKLKHQVSCSHSYECNCYYVDECTGYGKNESCHMVRHCQTCYEHDYDISWSLHSSTNEWLDINRIDRQGLLMPPRWGAAYVGEPFSSRHTFTNYIKANPDSVLLGSKGDQTTFGIWVPTYPDNIYDYYKHDPVINMGVPNVDLATWNWLIREVNKQLGPTKQVNVIVILVPTKDRAYMLALKDAWLGGKKNDVDIVIGSPNGHDIAFTEVMSWSTNKAMAVDLRMGIQAIGTLDHRDDIQQVILTTVSKEFVRMHMKDMQWLISSFQPSSGAMTVLCILGILSELGLAYWSVTNDITYTRKEYE